MSYKSTNLPNSLVSALKHSLWTLAIIMTAALLACTTNKPAPTVEKLVDIGEPDNLEISFLAKAPVIDGALDPELAALPGVSLPVFRNRAENAPAAPVSAVLAYGADFLYIYVEAAQDRIQCRDRAYQRGDGIILALASPQDGDAATDEFQVLGFSPQAWGRRNWQYAFTWYKDRDWIGFPPLEGAQFAWSHSAGRARFEVLVPWSAVAPYHPWFRSEIGLNLAYTQAVGTQGIINYQLVPDERLQFEISPRLYRRVRFAAPDMGTAMTWHVALESHHSSVGKPIVLRVASQGTGETALSITIRQGKRALTQSTVPVKAAAELASAAVPLDTGSLMPGDYEVEVRDSAGILQRMPFGILSALDLNALRAELEAAKERLPEGSLSTLEFRLQEIEGGMARLRPHAVGTSLAKDMAALDSSFQALRKGEDPVSKQTGVVRRSFRSRIDNTLQPYSIRPIAAPNPGRKYPVVVFLHGSASDDRNQLDGWQAMLPDFILVAPYARGTSHDYTRDGAQEDIKEVLADVEQNYPVDPSRIFLAGFSMGGYGVYRTFYEDPMRYRGLIVLSGLTHSDISDPDFRNPRYLAPFKGVEMFITHGTEDRNCPFSDAENVVGVLRAAGARVEFAVQPGRGHESPTFWTAIRMLTWLKSKANT